MWSWSLLPLIAAMAGGLLAWHQATGIDQQSARENWPRHTEPSGAWVLAVGALVTAVAAITILQVMFLPRLMT
jgi:hypothetical protein